MEEGIKLDPNDPAIRTSLATYRKELQARKEAQKKAFAKMFG